MVGGIAGVARRWRSELVTVVLIVEPNPSGHRLSYVALVARACLSQGATVVLRTNPHALAHENWSLHLGPLAADIDVRTDKDHTLGELARMARHLRATRTIILESDNYLPSVLMSGWNGHGRLSLLVMRDEVQAGNVLWKGARTFLKRSVAIAVSARRGVDVRVLRSPLDRRGGLLKRVPDPVELSDTPDERENIRSGMIASGKTAWIGVFGRITERKNLPLILEAVWRIRDTCGLLIAGSLDDDARSALLEFEASGKRDGMVVIELPAPVSDNTLDSAIAVVDCVVAAHSNEGPSGIVAKAAALGRPLVLSGAKSLMRDAKALPGQAEWVELRIDELCGAMNRALSADVSAANERFDAVSFVEQLIPELEDQLE